jgi:Ca2+-binding EF-hand superfamily protein
MRRADALLTVLDADKDGAISEPEFTDGAMALLRRAGARHHHHRVHDDDHGSRHDWHERRAARLERKLEKLFDRIDVDRDGGVSKEELTSALAKVTRA